MAKLDWGKASLRELDPARIQRTADFVTPDQVVKKTKLGKVKRKKARAAPSKPPISHTAAFEAAMRGYLWLKSLGQPEADKAPSAKKRATAKVTAKPKPAPKVKPKEPRRVEKARRTETDAQREARAAHQERYDAKARKQQAAMAAKKKTHLQAWAEKQDGLRSDRAALHEKWRGLLLRHPDQE